MPKKRLRQKNNIATTWNLNLLLVNPTDKSLLIDIKRSTNAVEKFRKKWGHRKDYLGSAKVLRQALDDYENLQKKWGVGGKANYYLELAYSLNQNDPKLKAIKNKVNEVANTNTTLIQFFDINLARITPTKQKLFLRSKLLAPYKHYLERVFAEGKYFLSEKEERILVLKSQVSHSNWTNMVSGLLAKEEKQIPVDGKKAIKNFSELVGLISSKDKATRDSAARGLNEIFERHVEVAEHELNSVLQNKKITDHLRRFKRPDLARHLSDDIESFVVDVLVGEVTRRFDLPQRYYTLRARIFGKTKIHYHEKQVEYGKVDKKYSFDKGVKIIKKVFGQLDPEFEEIFKSFVSQGRVDVFPKKGKRGGAFAIHNLQTQPTYLMLNWTDRLDDVKTFAHELGHGINYEMIRKKQNTLNFGAVLSTTEVASTFMEDFVNEELAKSLDGEEKLSLMISQFDDDAATIFRQVAFYNFERELHEIFREKGYLSCIEIGKLFTKHLDAYLGKSVLTRGYENWWVYVSHFRRFFYVYSYANGQLISKALQAKVRQNPKFITSVKTFLSTGLAESPQETFAKMGINISKRKFWQLGLSEIEKNLDDLESLAKSLGKL